MKKHSQGLSFTCHQVLGFKPIRRGCSCPKPIERFSFYHTERFKHKGYEVTCTKRVEL